MFIELIDALRCPAGHPPSALVAAFEAVTDRDVVSGMLGCPVCRAEYPIEGGELWLAPSESTTESTPAISLGAGDDHDALRLAAALDLRSEAGFAMLRGAWCALAAEIVDISPTHLVLLDPPPGTPSGLGRSVIRAGGAMPFLPATAVAAAIDDAASAYPLALSVKPGGRLVGPHGVELPPGVTELARDDRWWVAERENASAPVSLRVAPRTGRR